MTLTAPDGAYTIGGGQWNYGQTMSESVGKSMFEMDQPTPENMLDLLRLSLTKLPIEALKPFQGFLGLADEFFDNVENAVNAIIDALGLRPVFQTVEAFGEWVAEFFTKLAGVFTGDIDSFVNWFQQSILSIFSWLPLSHLFPKPVNLLKLAAFDAESDMSETEGWEWDATTSASSDGGGSAKVTCDGSTKFLVRNQVIFVEPGTKLNLQARVKSSGLTGSNAKIVLSLVEYAGDAMGDIVTVASRGPSTPWATFGGEYTVPDRITKVYVRLAVTEATAGTVWFDNLNLYRSGLLQMNWIEGLGDALNEAGDWFQNFIDGFFEALYGIPIIGGTIEAIFTGVSDLVNDVEGVIGDLADLIWGLLNNVAGVLGTIPRLLVDGLQGLLDSIGTQATNAWNNVTGLASNLLAAPAAVIGSIVSVVVDGVATMGQFLSQLWEGLTGQTGSNKTVANVKTGAGTLVTAAATAQATANTANGNAGAAQTAANNAQATANNAEAQAVANAAELAKLTAANKGGNFGVYAYDNFDYVNNSNPDPAQWSCSASGAGGLRADGSKLYWSDSGGAAATWFCRFLTKTTSSYQVVSMVLDSPLVESPNPSQQAYNFLVGRLKSDWSSYVYLRVGYNSLSIWKVAAGQEVQIGNAVSYTPKVGDTIQFVIGNPDTSDIRQFKALVNNNPILTPPTDTTFYGGFLSVEDATNNTWSGMIAQAGARAGGGQTTPGAVSIFSVADNKGAPILGSGIQASRSTGTAATISSGDNVFPVGWFSTFDKTPDLEYSNSGGAVNRVTVSVEGWYEVVINQYGDSDVGANPNDPNRKICAMLWKGSGAGARAPHRYGRKIGWRTADRFFGFDGTFQVYLKPGEWIEPGYSSDTDSGTAGLMTGSSAQTWFSMSLLNRSYN